MAKINNINIKSNNKIVNVKFNDFTIMNKMTKENSKLFVETLNKCNNATINMYTSALVKYSNLDDISKNSIKSINNYIKKMPFLDLVKIEDKIIAIIGEINNILKITEQKDVAFDLPFNGTSIKLKNEISYKAILLLLELIFVKDNNKVLLTNFSIFSKEVQQKLKQAMLNVTNNLQVITI